MYYKEKKKKMIVFSAPSGAGKTTIVKSLLQKSSLNLEFSISATTREKRPHETDTKDYYFISIKSFKEKIKNKEFIEWEEVYSNCFYGTLKEEVIRIWKSGKHVIFDIDVAGGLRIKKKYPELTLAVFVNPPSLDELKNRLEKRQTENKDKIDMRLSKAADEIATAPLFDVILENNDLEKAQKEAIGLVGDFLNGRRLR